ncbi:MAG: acyl-CoA dehydrogenase family protein [Sporichthyaceae bacterium]
MSSSVTTISTAPGELGTEAAAAIRAIARKIANGRTSTTILEDDLSASWTALEAGGWDCVGIRDGADGASLLDLVVIGQAWGEYCLPLPLIPTVLVKRWSAPAAEHDGPVTFAVPHASGQGALVPFAAAPGIRLCTELGEGADSPLVDVDATGEDDLAATLGLGRTAEVSKLSAEAAHECAVVWGAEAVGAARRLLDEGVAYAKVREQFGTPIGSFQAVKHQLADGHILTEQAETAVLWAATSPADARRALRYAFRACRGVAERSIQVHGGVGFTWEWGLHFYLRHIMALDEAATAVLP